MNKERNTLTTRIQTGIYNLRLFYTQPKQKQSWSLKYQMKNKTLQSVQNFAQSEIQKQILTPKTYFMK